MMMATEGSGAKGFSPVAAVPGKYRLLIIGAIAVAVLSFAVNGIIDARQPELYIKVVPNMPTDPFKPYDGNEKSERLEHKKLIASLLPDVKAIDYEEKNNISSSEFQLSMDCFAGQADVFIVGDSLFQELVEGHYAMNLDAYAEKLGVSPENNLGLYKKGGRKDGLHLYGINADASLTAKSVCRNFDRRIAVVFAGTRHERNAIRFIQALCSN